MLVRLLSLPAYPLTDNTESRYAEVAREMAVSGDWVTPRLGGEPFWAKPPLSTWASAAGIVALGSNELGARLPQWLFGVVILGLTFVSGRMLYGAHAGALAMVILASTPLFLVLAGGVMTDPALAFATTLAMTAFIGAWRSNASSNRRCWGYVFFIALALGLLAKGPVALVLTGLPVFMWLLWQRNWPDLWRSLPWLSGSLLMLAIALPWYLLAEHRTPGFLNYYLIGEHISRFLDSQWQGDLYGSAHSRPRGMIWGFWVLAALPWSIVIVTLAGRLLVRHRGAWRTILAEPFNALLLTWSLAPMIFFSFSGSILPTYVYPGLPAMALLGVRLLAALDDLPANDYRARNTFYALAGIVPAGIVVLLLFGQVMPAVYDGFTQQRVVHRFHQLAAADSQLAYANRNLPFSAMFYAGDRAIRPLPGPDWAPLIHSAGVNFVVSDDGDLDRIPRRLRKRLEKIDLYGDRWLYRLPPAVAATPSVLPHRHTLTP